MMFSRHGTSNSHGFGALSIAATMTAPQPFCHRHRQGDRPSYSHLLLTEKKSSSCGKIGQKSKTKTKRTILPALLAPATRVLVHSRNTRRRCRASWPVAPAYLIDRRRHPLPVASPHHPSRCGHEGRATHARKTKEKTHYSHNLVSKNGNATQQAPPSPLR